MVVARHISEDEASAWSGNGLDRTRVTPVSTATSDPPPETGFPTWLLVLAAAAVGFVVFGGDL